MTTKATFLRRLARPGVALAEPIVPTRFSSPVTARLTETSFRQTRGGSLAELFDPQKLLKLLVVQEPQYA